MRARVIVGGLAPFLWTLSACISTHAIRIDEPGPLTELNSAAAGQTGKLFTSDSTILRDYCDCTEPDWPIRFRELYATARDVTFTRVTTGERLVIATPQVMEVQFTDRREGVRKGFLGAAAIGGAAGLVLGVIFSFGDAPEAKALATGIGLGAAAGILIGIPLGAVSGAKERYILTDDR